MDTNVEPKSWQQLLGKGCRDELIEQLVALPADVQAYIYKQAVWCDGSVRGRVIISQELLRDYVSVAETCDASEGDATTAFFANWPRKRARKLIRRARKAVRPLYIKILLGAIKTLFILLLFWLGLCFYMITGTPTVSDRYALELNSRVRNGRPESQNAAPLYEQVILTWREIPEDAKGPMDKLMGLDRLTDEELACVRDWVDLNAAGWEAISRNREYPYYWPDYVSADARYVRQDRYGKIRFPEYHYYRIFAYYGYASVVSHLRAQRYAMAVQDCLTLARMGRHLHSIPLYNNKPIGSWILMLAVNAELAILADDDLDESSLMVLKIEMANLLENYDFFAMDAECEWLFRMDALQCFYTEGGLKGGHLVLSQQNDFYERLFGIDSYWRDVLRYGLFSPMQLGRHKVDALYKELYRWQAERLREPPNSFHSYGRTVPMEDCATPYTPDKHSLKYDPRSMTQKYVDVLHCLKGQVEAARCVLAAKEYHREYGHYPTSLPELVEAGYLKTVPIDPFSGKPWIYSREGDDFRLYSIGDDYKDNNCATDDDRQLDWVVWPRVEWAPSIFWFFW